MVCSGKFLSAGNYNQRSLENLGKNGGVKKMRLIVLDYGGSAIKYGLLERKTGVEPVEGRFLEKGSVPNTFADQEAFLAATYELIDGLSVRWGGTGEEELLGIAISYCGELDHKTGYIPSPGAYYYNRNLQFGDLLRERYRMPVSIENDGNAAMLAEWKYGALRGYENACMMVLGSGIAGAFIINGELFTGKHGYAGFLSTLFANLDSRDQTVLDKSLAGMGTKQKEGFSAGVAASGFLAKTYLERSEETCSDPDAFDGRAFFEKYHEGDPLAAAVLDEFAGNFARMLVNTHLTVEMEAFAIGGGISAQDVLLEKIREKVHEALQLPLFAFVQLPEPEIVRAVYGNDANLIGAAEWFFTLYQK